MASRNRKGRLFSLFKDDFKITFYHKPSMELEDTFYYMTLDDLIRIKLKIRDEILVIDEIIPLTSAYLAKVYDKIIEIFIKQTSFTVLLSLIGNTTSFVSTCIKYDAPIVDDERYITVPVSVYSKLKQY
jgi:hypothetical protein